MALFFVALGMSLPPPDLEVLGGALALVGIVVALRLLVFAPTLLAARMGPLVSLASAINLAQLSEFSLLFVPLGIAQGALSVAEGSVLSYAMMLSVLLSTYGITYNYRLASALARLLRLPTLASRGAGDDEDRAAAGQGGGHGAEILLLGFHHDTEALAQHLGQHAPQLLPRMLVVDFSLKRHARVAGYGLRVVYGDISNPETLRHHGAARAAVVLSTVSDAFLRGTSNLRLLQQVRTLNPRARVVVTAESAEQVRSLLQAGADGCVCPALEAAPSFAALLERLLPGADPRGD
jgi:hypothetical protein